MLTVFLARSIIPTKSYRKHSLVNSIASKVQLQILRLLSKIKPTWNRVGFIFPSRWIYCGGQIPLVTYQEVFVKEEYAPPIILPPNAHILDLGAHIGLATMYFSIQYPSAQIDSYEANPATYAILEKNLSVMPNANAHLGAVGSNNGLAELFIEDTPGVPTDASIVSRDSSKTGRLISVELLDVRQLVQEPVDLVKLDIEGAEHDCLDVIDLNPNIIRCLVIEFHDYDRDPSKINKSLMKLKNSGYSLYDKKKISINLPFLPENDSELIWAVDNVL